MNGLLRQSQLFIRRHGATILTAMGGVGVIATTVSAVKATPKAMEIIKQAEKEKGEELSKWETVLVTGKTYAPTVLLGAGTLVCIFGANMLNKKQQAAIMSAYTLIDRSYHDYRRKLQELYGKEAHDRIVHELAIEEAREVGITAECLGSGTCLTDEDACGEPVLFYDVWSKRYFEATIEQVITAEYHINRNLVLRGYVILNELYEFIGLDTTDYGFEVGWTVNDSFYWIDFNHHKAVLDDGLECFIIDTPWGPSGEFKEYYY